MEEGIRETQKKYGSRAMVAAILIGFVLILAGYKPMGKGLVLGTLFSIINFVLMGEALPLRLGFSKSKTFFISLLSIFFRYLVLAVPLIAAVKSDQFHLAATIVGIFAVQLTILCDHLVASIRFRRESQV